ncbi:MAG: hypothetical protein JWQ34_1755 [Mucilaginibacter sp.]|nr:hypothetical protein [Mucilaginibacter sp.]MDB5003530.1 hypothetical protein [Mucilaginibacter sp.]
MKVQPISLVWNKVTNPSTGEKIILDALVKRRAKERQLFLSNITKTNI